MNISLTAIGLLWTMMELFSRVLDHKVMERDTNWQFLGMRMELFSTTGNFGRMDATVDSGSEGNPNCSSGEDRQGLGRPMFGYSWSSPGSWDGRGTRDSKFCNTDSIPNLSIATG